MVSATVREFHWADYLVFSAVLVISAVIGITAAIKEKKTTVEHLLTGNRNLPLLPVAISLTVSFLSAISILSNPVEAYFNGLEIWFLGLALILGQILTALFFLPMIYKLKVTSGYEYLELRFNKVVRILGSLTFSINMVLYMAVVLYMPALALSHVTGLSMELSILGTGLVCTLYTALGGMKAVVWTDTFQMVVIIAGLMVLIVKGVIDVGGWDLVMEKAKEGGRFTWEINFDPDPFVRHTFWTLVIGGCFTALTVYGSNQTMLQRYISVKSLSKARWTLLTHLLISEVTFAFTMMFGIVMYAYYFNCDPLFSRSISKPDQLVPFFMMETLGDFPGLPGLFVACIYSGALSTVSSGVNALSAVMLRDFLDPFIKRLYKEKNTERLRSIITVISGILYGLLTIGLAYLAGLMGKTGMIISFSIFGMVGGPLLGIFVLGIFFPCINSWGAGAGLLSSLVVCLWTGIGAILNPPARPPSSLRPLSIESCNKTAGDLYTSPAVNETLATPGNSSSLTIAAPSKSALEHWYSLSYQYYALLAVIVCIIVGFIVSAFTGFNRGRQLDTRTYLDVLGCCRSRTGKSSECESDEKTPDAPEEKFQSTRL